MMMMRAVACAAAVFSFFPAFSGEEVFPLSGGGREGEKWISLSPGQAEKYEQGFSLSGDGREFICDNGTDALAKRGVRWTVDLNQREAAPVSFSASGCSEGVDWAPDEDYCIYLDIIHMDGTPLWGQKARFDPSRGARWHRRTVTVFPDRPIRRVSAYLLFRGIRGRARFRGMEYFQAAPGAKRFDSLAVEPGRVPSSPCFLIRDVARNSGFTLIRGRALDIRMSVEERKRGDAAFFDVTLENLTGKDRALTLCYLLPLPEGKLVWHEDARSSRPLSGRSSERMTAVHVEAGTGRLSRYPFIAVSAGGEGLALGGDPDAPCFSRSACQPSMRLLHFSCDLALTPEVPRAHLKFCSFRFNGAEAFRGALEKYHALFPDAFRVRIKDQGVWMPFAAISGVEGWEDFGFRFKEGDDETAWDDAHGILTFRYTEPATWWMAMKEKEYSYADCLQRAEGLAAKGDRAALAWKSSAFLGENGRIPGRMMDTPWCRGIVWSMNSAPGIRGAVPHYALNNGEPGFSGRFAPKPPEGLDGEYVDSSELYATAPLDFRRDHFAAMKTPLCFSPNTHKPAVFKGMIGYEYVRRQSERVHARGRYAMANDTPKNWWWLAPCLDVMGTETDWNPGGRWSPMSDADLLYRRSICGAKPYCFLMNTDFTRFSRACGEKFMMRSLAYGMFPGYFSADASTGQYFRRPELYNRDRPLFKKYIPLCRRVAEAGWRPVNRLLASDEKDVVTEQFGPGKGGAYATVYNLSSRPRKAALEWKARPPRPVELVTGEVWRWEGKRSVQIIPPETVRVLAF